MPAKTFDNLNDIETWVFDLDNTLYPATCNLFAQIDVRMRDFISAFLGLEPDEAYKIQKHYFREYGTTLRGMMTPRHGLRMNFSITSTISMSVRCRRAPSWTLPLNACPAAK